MKTDKKYTRNEELANAYSHLAGAILAAIGLVLMLSKAANHGQAIDLITCLVFGSTMVILYFSSTMTHILHEGKKKDFFFNLDRIAIYLLIAGSYTPIALGGIGGTLGWVIFGIEWGIAIAGTLMIIFKPGDYDKGVNTFYVISYALMGWLVLFVIGPVSKNLPGMGLIWIIIGGIFYSIGIFFFKFGKFPYHHLIWHILVIAGSFSHFIAVYYYIIPQ